MNDSTKFYHFIIFGTYKLQQESPAIADKPARRESLPKIAPMQRAYNQAHLTMLQ